MSRGTSSQLDAVFAMPGLEQVAEPLFPYVRKESDAVALVAYLASRPVLRSANAADDELGDEAVWQRLHRVADGVGRELPNKSPTFDKLRHLRDRIGDDLPDVLRAMQHEFTAEAFKLARSVGLADPATVGDLTLPVRANTLYADGTWWHPLSKAYLDPITGEPVGSRTTGRRCEDGTWWREAERRVDPMTGEVVYIEAKQVHGPRVAEKWTTTKRGKVIVGVPFVMAGVRGENEHQRVVLGMRRFWNPGLEGDGGETTAADELLDRVVAASGGGLAWCVYDMAFRGVNLERLATRGVVGVAAMPSAGKDQRALTDDGRELGPVRFNNDGRKVRFSTGSVATVQHRVGDRWCEHMLSGVDGSLRTHPMHRQVNLRDPLCELRELWFEPAAHGRKRLWARYEVPCVHGSLTKKLELTGDVKATKTLVLNRVRPISEYDPKFAVIKGWREDVENLNSMMKRVTPLYGQATSLAAAHFELDVLGSALWINSTSWDIHAAAVSPSAQKYRRAQRKKVLNQKLDF